MKIYFRIFYLFIGGFMAIFGGYKCLWYLSRLSNYSIRGVPYFLMLIMGLIFLVFGLNILKANKFSHAALLISAVYAFVLNYMLLSGVTETEGGFGISLLIVWAGLISIILSVLFLFISLIIAIYNKFER